MRAAGLSSLTLGLALALAPTVLAPGVALADDATPASSAAPAASAKPVAAAPAPARPGSADSPSATPMMPPKHEKMLPPNPKQQPGEKREPQDYEGRPHHTSTLEDVLWVPRILLFPVYVVVDYVVRRPIGAAVMAVEANDVIAKVTDFFTFGPTDNVGLVPTAFYDYGFRPSVGLYLFYNDFLFKNNALRSTISTGGDRFFKARITDRIPLQVETDKDGNATILSYFQLDLEGLERPDYPFFGIGWNSDHRDQSYFEQRTAGGGIRVHVEPKKGNFVESWANVSKHSFSNTACHIQVEERDDGRKFADCANQPILRAVNRGLYPLPPGFDGYSVVKTGARVVLDSRKQRPASGSGVAIDLRGELADAFDATVGSWAQLGGSLGGFLDLTGTRRILGLSLDARMIEPYDKVHPVPFTELIGAMKTDYALEDDLMRGFLPGRLLGQSSINLSLEYSWPIWSFIDATLQAQVGNVFDQNFQDLKSLDQMRFSFVGGFRSPNHRDHALNLLVGFGTRPFVEGGAPDSLRFLVGGTTGF